MKRYLKTVVAVLAGLDLISASSWAQETTNLRDFDAAYFEQFAPTTALEMIERIPGFQFNTGSNRRGLGQGGANVLINGKRISGKSGDIRTQISQIVASNVVRIKILDGASLGIVGLSGQVADIITETSGMSGSWEWRPEWREDLKPNLLPGFVSVSGEHGDLEYTFRLQNDSFRGGGQGPEERRDSSGELFEVRQERNFNNADNPGVLANITWSPQDGHTANLNLEYNEFNFNGQVFSDLIPITSRGQSQVQVFSNAEDEWNAQIDGDYERPAFDGTIKLIGYYRVEDSPTVNRFQVFDTQTGLIQSTEFRQDADEGEAIARAEYAWNASEGRDWQVAVEGAFNFLDVEALFVDQFNPPVPGALDTRSRIEELRAEATLTHTLTLSPKWDVQASIGAEYSEISSDVRDVPTDVTVSQKDTFFRPKGFISTAYKLNPDTTVRARIDRDVGQLNFFDFIAQVDLSDNLNRTANANIVPAQSWEGELEYEQQFTGGHSLQVRAYGELISDLVDRIPIGVSGDAIGNIDNAKRYGVDALVNFKSEPFGFKGAELELKYELRESFVDDPVEDFVRALSNDKRYFWAVDFRHDIPNTKWAYGFFAEQFRNTPGFRSRNIDTFRFEGSFGLVYLEYKDFYGMKVRADLRNLFDASDDFRRVIFTDRRDRGVVDFTEDRSRSFGKFFRLTLSGNF